MAVLQTNTVDDTHDLFTSPNAGQRDELEKGIRDETMDSIDLEENSSIISAVMDPEILKGGRKAMYQTRRTLSQLHIMNYTRFTQAKATY